MKTAVCLLAATVLLTLNASARIPASLQSKIGSDAQLAAVRGGKPPAGITITITPPTLTINRPTIPIVQFNAPPFPGIVVTPLIVNNSGTITVTLPTITVTTTPPTITKPASPLVTFTLPSITVTR